VEEIKDGEKKGHLDKASGAYAICRNHYQEHYNKTFITFGDKCTKIFSLFDNTRISLGLMMERIKNEIGVLIRV